MSLVITEISKFGVVMVADNAETRVVIAPSGREYIRVNPDAQKLFALEEHNGGVSFWGANQVLADDVPVPTDVWLEDLVSRERQQSLEQVAFAVAKYANVQIGVESPAIGFQVAGIEEAGANQPNPVFYRISNRDHHNGVQPSFEVERFEQFPTLEEKNAVFADGDRQLYLDLEVRLTQNKPLATRQGPIPNPSLVGRAEYQAAFVRFVSDLYQSAGLRRTISRGVTLLTVAFDGSKTLRSI